MDQTTQASAEIVQELWREIARLDPHATPATLHAFGAAGVAPAATLGSQPALSELLALEGDAFISAAYGAVLSRSPDPTGTDSIRAALAAGTSKARVLGGLQNSAEGRAAGSVIPGLRARALLDAACGHRVLGPPLRLVRAAMRRAGLAHRIAAISERPGLQASRLASLSARLRTLELARLQAETSQHGQGAERLRLDRLAYSMQQLSERLDAVTRRLVALDQSVTGPLASVVKAVAVRQPAAMAAGADALTRRVAAVEASVDRLQQAAADQQRRIAQAVDGRTDTALEQQDAHALDELYVAFEDSFRGSRAAIKDRQRVYLPDLREAGAGTPQRPVLDVGSGRGELLELLRDEGMAASGIDLNEAMARQCRALGLAVTTGDAVAGLCELASGSLGAVTGFHIIEHLPYRTMVRLLDESLRALAPGGIVIFETPNPANLLVASRYFYLDPTHRNPLPGEMVAAIATARGFTGAEIRELHPMQKRFDAEDAGLGAQLDALFHGPMDYVLIARKP